MGFDLVSCLRRPRGGLWGTRGQCHDLVFECLGVWLCGLTFSLHFSALLVVTLDYWSRRCPVRTGRAGRQTKLDLRFEDSRERLVLLIDNSIRLPVFSDFVDSMFLGF